MLLPRLQFSFEGRRGKRVKPRVVAAMDDDVVRAGLDNFPAERT